MTRSRDVRSRVQWECTALAEESTVLVVPLLEASTVPVAESTAPVAESTAPEEGSTAQVAWLEAMSTVETVESNLQK